MTTHTLHNGGSAIVSAGQWDGDSLAFAGTSNAAGEVPTLTITGPTTLTGVTDRAVATSTGYGVINLTPGASLTTGSLTVNQSMLSVIERPGAKVTFNGNSNIRNASVLTATGYAGAGVYSLNGTMTIGDTSTVNMDYVAVTGSGRFHLTGADTLLRLGSVGAGETVALDSGMLSLTNGMNFLATITDSAPGSSRIGQTSSVDVYNAFGAVQETFNQTTGMLNLFDAGGVEVTSLKFAGAGALYAAPTTGLATNYISITSHLSAGALPVTFTR